MDRVRAQLYADEAHRRGITGRGVVAAVLDTGLSPHPDCAKRILCFRDFVNGKQQCYDDASHGTHVSGILGGDGSCSGGKYCGVAPGCSLIALKVLDRWGQGKLDSLLAAIEWGIKNRERYGIRIMNLSAGTTKEEKSNLADRLVSGVEAAWDAGITVVVAAGNMGPEPESVTVPGNSRKVITVGASDEFPQAPPSGSANYSGCGPTADCICKPDFVAPGTGIISCSSSWKRGNYYAKRSGTSMAAPSIAGVIALLLEKEPELTNVEIKMRLRESADDLGLARNRQGWGMPNLRRLLAEQRNL